jgi:hypothetical protein
MMHYLGRLVYSTFEDQFCTSRLGQYDSTQGADDSSQDSSMGNIPVCIARATVAPTQTPSSSPVSSSPVSSHCDAPTPRYLGDGFCDKYGSYNTAACGYDGGDCCARSCLERGQHVNTCGVAGYDCLDPSYNGAVWLYSETLHGSNCTSGDFKSLYLYRAPACTRVTDSSSYDIGCSGTNGDISYRYYSNADCTPSSMLHEDRMTSHCTNSLDSYHDNEVQSSRGMQCSLIPDFAGSLSLSSQYPDKKLVEYRLVLHFFAI